AHFVDGKITLDEQATHDSTDLAGRSKHSYSHGWQGYRPLVEARTRFLTAKSRPGETHSMRGIPLPELQAWRSTRMRVFSGVGLAFVAVVVIAVSLSGGNEGPLHDVNAALPPL